MICNYCKNEFQPKSKKAIFCSTKCRVYAGRGKERIVTPVIEVPKRIVTPKVEAPKKLETLDYYLEEYERVYLGTKAPSFIPQKVWDLERRNKLEHLKIIINQIKQSNDN